MDKQGLASSLPIPTIDGQQFIEKKTLFILKRGIKGEPLTIQTILEKNMAKWAVAYGTAIAQFHNAFIELEEQILCNPSNLYKTVVR